MHTKKNKKKKSSLHVPRAILTRKFEENCRFGSCSRSYKLPHGRNSVTRQNGDVQIPFSAHRFG